MKLSAGRLIHALPHKLSNIGALWTATVVIMIGFGLLEDTARYDFLFKVLSEVVSTPFALIMTFFYGGHYVNQVVNNKK